MIQVVITLLMIGLLVALVRWAAAQVPGFPPFVLTIIYIVIVFCVVIWLLRIFGVLNYDIPVPHLV